MLCAPCTLCGVRSNMEFQLDRCKVLFTIIYSINIIVKKGNGCRGHCDCKVCGCYLVRFSYSPASTNWIYTTKLMLHQQICNETSANTRLKSNLLLFSYDYRK